MDFATVVAFILIRLEWAIIVYFFIVNSFYAVLLVSAFWEMRQHTWRIRDENRWRVLGSEAAPSVSVLAPAYNEESTIHDSVRALLALYYPGLEVIVINDGSRDGTLEALKATFDLVAVHNVHRATIPTKAIRAQYRSRSYPNLVVVDKENGGKADALNVGLNVANGQLVCAIDADTLIETDALQRMVRPFLAGPGVLAAGGTIRIANGSAIEGGRLRNIRAPTNPVAGFQVVEYLRAFLFGRLGWNRLGGNLIISGAFGLFRRDAVEAAGGYAHDTVGEDMELVVRLRRMGIETGGPHRIEFIPDPVAWTEAPESLRVLGRQRDRWHRGLADALWRHRILFFNPRYGSLGMVVFPYFVIVELLAPLVEAVGLVGLVGGLLIGGLNLPIAILFFLVAYGYGIVLSMATLALEETSYHRYASFRDRLILTGWTLGENLGFRQLTVYWRLQGLLKYFRGKKDWGAMERRGLSRPQA